MVSPLEANRLYVSMGTIISAGRKYIIFFNALLRINEPIERERIENLAVEKRLQVSSLFIFEPAKKSRHSAEISQVEYDLNLYMDSRTMLGPRSETTSHNGSEFTICF